MPHRDLDVRLARYALMAGAAVAATKPANASVIYSVEPVPIDYSSGSHSLDLNSDLIEDFFFSGGPLAVSGNSFSYSFTISAPMTETIVASSSVSFTGCGTSGTFTTSVFFTFSSVITVSGGSSSAVGYSIDEIAVSGSEAIAFGSGAVIGTNIASEASEAAMDEFTATGLEFLGLNFYDSNGNQYFGFAEFDPQNFIGFAFDNNPGTAITTFDVAQSPAPEPSTLATLALGAAAMEFIRRKRKQRA